MGLVPLEEEGKVPELLHVLSLSLSPPLYSMHKERLCEHTVSRCLSESQTQSPHQNLTTLTP